MPRTKNSRKQKSKARPRPAQAKKRLAPQRPFPALQHCAAEFLHALADPFGTKPICHPMGVHLDSIRCKTYYKGNITTGNFDPCAVIVTGSEATDSSIGRSVPVQLGSTPLPVGVGLFPTGAFSPVSAITSGSVTNKPILSAIRVRNISRQVDRGGRACFWVDQEDYKVVGMTPDAIYSKPNTIGVPTDGSWATAVFSSLDPRVLQFSATVTPWAGLDISATPLVFIAFGSGSANVYEYEIVHFYETRIQSLAMLHQAPGEAVSGASEQAISAAVPAALARSDSLFDTVSSVVQQVFTPQNAQALVRGIRLANTVGRHMPGPWSYERRGTMAHDRIAY